MQIYKAAIFLLTSLFFISLSSAQPNDIDQICDRSPLPANAVQNAQKGFYVNHLFFRNAHMCHGSRTLLECTAPDKVTSIPKLYACIWSPVAQDYDIIYLVTDIAGTVYYMQSNTWVGAEGQVFWHGVHWNAGVLDALPEGDYKIVIFAVGKTNAQLAISDPYTFHKLPAVQSSSYYQD